MPIPALVHAVLALASSPGLDHCLATGDAAKGITPAMAACFGADYRRADVRLNEIYAATMTRLPAARQAALRTSQRAWIRQRDSACRIARGEGAATIERLNHSACLTKQTDRRIAWLARYR